MRHATTDRYFDELVRGVEAWTAQGVALAITGGYDGSTNQPLEAGWQLDPIRSVADFERHVERVRFEVRGIAAIHGAGFGTFALDMDRDDGRADFAWLTAHGFVTSEDLVVDSPGGVHIIYRHDARLGDGSVQHPANESARVILDGLDGPRGDGSLHVTLRGRSGANVTKVPPTRRPQSGGRYSSRSGWEWNPRPLPGWFRLPQRSSAPSLVPVPPAGSKSRYGEAALVGEVEILLGTAKGGRNTQLNTSALKLGTLCAVGVLDLIEVGVELFKASERNGHVRDKGERSTWATIRSGLSAGLRSPREVAS